MMNILSYSVIAPFLSDTDAPGASVNHVLFALLIFIVFHYLWMLRKHAYSEQKFRFCRNAIYRANHPLMVTKTILENLVDDDIPPTASIEIKRVAGYLDDILNNNKSLFSIQERKMDGNFITYKYDLYAYITSITNYCREYAESRCVKLNVYKGTDYTDCSINEVAFTTALQSLIEKTIRRTPQQGSVNIIVSCRDDKWSLEIFNSLHPVPDYRRYLGMFLAQLKMLCSGSLGFIGLMVRWHGGGMTGCELGKSIHYKITVPLCGDDSGLPEAGFDAGKLPNILLVTEDKELSSYLKKSLARLCRVSVTGNYTEIPRCLSRGDTDMVLIDETREGRQLCKKIKSSKQTSDVTVVMLTDFDDAQACAAAEECEADWLLPRMIHCDRLKAEFRAFIDERHERRARVVKLVHPAFSVDNPQGVIINEKDAATIEKLNGLLKKHLHDGEYQLKQLAADMNVCRTSLYKEIRRITKVSPTHYIFTFKMERAGQQVLEGELKVNEIATMMGYATGEYFTKRFRKYHGVSPKGYVKREGKQLRPC